MAKYLDSNGLSYLWGKIKAALSGKQDALVSGTNIKTINNQSLLGSGNITISGGGGGGLPEVDPVVQRNTGYMASLSFTDSNIMFTDFGGGADARYFTLGAMQDVNDADAVHVSAAAYSSDYTDSASIELMSDGTVNINGTGDLNVAAEAVAVGATDVTVAATGSLAIEAPDYTVGSPELLREALGIQTGTFSMTPAANGITSETFTFAKPYAAMPIVFADVASGVDVTLRDRRYGATATETQITIYCYNGGSNTTSRRVNWLAIGEYA